jgi:DNA-binding SARP family transcriptional activator
VANGAEPDLRLRLLGGFELRADGRVLTLDSGRGESLLAYLVLHGDVQQSRQGLAFLLWPDSTEVQARTNLRHLLHTIRNAVPQVADILELTPRTVRWRPGVACGVDVAEFDAALDRAAGLHADARVAALQAAIDGYGGDLLPGCYDDWLLTERARVHGRFVEALDGLSTLLHAQGDNAAAERYGARLLLEDPLRESTYRLLIDIYGAEELTRRAERLRALGDPTRLRIAHAPHVGDELCVCDLAWIVGSSQGLVSHHLRQLRSAGLVGSRRDGKLVMYRLSPTGHQVLATVTVSITAVDPV